MSQLPSPLTANESSALIWAFIGLVGILVAIGWYYIKSSISSQKEISKTLMKMRLTQTEHIKDIENHDEDIKEIKKSIISINRKQETFGKDLEFLRNKI